MVHNNELTLIKPSLYKLFVSRGRAIKDFFSPEDKRVKHFCRTSATVQMFKSMTMNIDPPFGQLKLYCTGSTTGIQCDLKKKLLRLECLVVVVFSDTW